MKKYLLIILTFSICFTGCSFKHGSISGTVTGPNGKELKTSGVLIEGFTNAIVHQYTEDGKFAFDNLEPGVYKVIVYGLHHETINFIPIVLEKGEDINLKIELDPVYLQTEASSLDLIVYEKKLVPPNVIPMPQKQDGTYAAKIPTPGDTIYYQVGGIFKMRDHDVDVEKVTAGTQADDYLFVQRLFDRNSGAIASILVTPDELTEIVFDPPGLQGGEEKGSVNVEPENSLAAKVCDKWSRIRKKKLDLDNARWVNHDTLDVVYKAEYYKWLKNQYKHEKNKLVQDYLLLSMMDMEYCKFDYRFIYKNIKIEPGSLAYSLIDMDLVGILGRLYSLSREPKAINALEAIIEENPNPNIQAQVLLYLVSVFYKTDNDRAMEYYKRLVVFYFDTHVAQEAIRKYDPENIITQEILKNNSI